MTDKIVLARFEGGYMGIYRQNILKGKEIIEGNSEDHCISIIHV